MSVRGFTLVELLLVISIIAILSGLLFPVFIEAKRSAQSSVCISNLKQVSVAGNLYLNDFDDHFPLATDGANRDIYLWLPDPDELLIVSAVQSSLPVTRDILNPYTKSNQIWQCPLDYGAVTDAPYRDSNFVLVTAPIAPSAYGSLGTSYAYRVALGFEATGTTSNCTNEAGAVLGSSAEFTDISGYWHGDQAELDVRHNVLYTDGHAKVATRDAFVGSWLCEMN